MAGEKNTFNKDVTVIIPIVKLDEDTDKAFRKALKSASEAARIIVVCPTGCVPENLPKKGVKVIENSGETDEASQINLAVQEVKTKWFSVLEMDDEYRPGWFEKAGKYIADMVDEPSLVLPIMELAPYGKESAETTGYGNESVWASSFSEEIGYLDLESTLEYAGYMLSGGIFRKDAFLDSGALKPSIKVAYWYEFLLRLLNQGKKVFVVPKVGYYHYYGRKGSLDDLFASMGDEPAWWIDTARKEYFYRRERKIEK